MFKMTPGAAVGGTVRNAKGEPISKAKVVFQVDDRIWHMQIAVTDSNGNYALDDLIPKGGFSFPDNNGNGNYNVSIRHPDYISPSKKLHVEPGDVVEKFDFDATAGVLVKGKV